MEKFCVFCGKAPEGKNKEHVLPDWLIRLTGDPNRIATFGIEFNKQPIGLRQFAFDALTFPACAHCNDRFSKLEAQIKPIIERLLASQPLGAGDLILLLDWLDKVRVGLWLGYMYLNKNPLGIDPTFHIESRIGQADRMVAISKIEDIGVGLTFSGPEFLTYQLSPTTFALRVNDFCLTNTSRISLCSPRLGFPYMQPVRIGEDHKLVVSPTAGSERIMNRVERSTPLQKVVALYQPIFRSFLEYEGGERFLANDWVKQNSTDVGAGYGKLFLQKRESVEVYPDAPSSDWVPSDSWKKSELLLNLPQYVFDRIHEDAQNAIGLTSTAKDRKALRSQVAGTGMVDKAMLRKSNEAIIPPKSRRSKV